MIDKENDIADALGFVFLGMAIGWILASAMMKPPEYLGIDRSNQASNIFPIRLDIGMPPVALLK